MSDSPRLRPPKQAFRYPGGKGKIGWDILKWFPYRVFDGIFADVSCYCEPFVGSGAILARILPMLPDSVSVVVGDADVGVAAFWRCLCDPAKVARLSKMIVNFVPTPDDFYRFKELDGTHHGDDADTGFRKLVLHQISFSGVGAMAGGPIGGRDQRSDYDVTCRFRPERHVGNIASLRHQFARFRAVEVVHGDFASALGRVADDRGFAYLDPPYYLKGRELYPCNMSPVDHARLADTLRGARYDWLLSYDDHPEVTRLYADWSRVHSFEMTATIDTKRGKGSRRKNNELVITNDNPERE